MKISKVDYTQSAVSIISNKGSRGILYEDPSQKAMTDRSTFG